MFRAPTWHKKAFGIARRSALAVFSPHKASLSRLADIPLTVAGAGCVAAGVFLASAVAGFIVLGFSLVLLEYLIADES